MTRALAPLALLVLVVLVHWPQAGADFAYDDREFVETNQSIRSFGAATAALLRPFPPAAPERGLYRPLTNFSYAIDFALHGERARGYHATNVLLYAAVVWLVHAFARSLLGSPGAAFAVALLFAVHPVHCEVVDGVAGRAELLALLFSLVSLLLFSRRARTPDPPVGDRWLLLSAGAYALGCLSKESAVVLPAILAVQRLAFSPPAAGRGWLRTLRPVAPHAAVLACYALLRPALLGRFTPAFAILAESDLATRLYTMGAVFGWDLRLLVWPPLQVDFFYQAAIGLVSRPTPEAILGWAALGALVAGAVALARRHLGRACAGEAARERAAALTAFAIFFGFLFPTSHVIDIGAVLAERFLFAPSLGFVLLGVLAARRGLAGLPGPVARRAVAAALLAGLTALGAWRSHARAGEWREPVRLWRSALAVVSGDARLHVNLASELIERGELPAAEAALEAALAIDPQHFAALGNLGVLQLEQGRLDEAEATFEALLVRDPESVAVWNGLGLVELARDRPERAVRHFERALALDPGFGWAVRNLAEARARLRADAR